MTTADNSGDDIGGVDGAKRVGPTTGRNSDATLLPSGSVHLMLLYARVLLLAGLALVGLRRRWVVAADRRDTLPRFVTRGTASRIDPRAVGVVTVICLTFAACTVQDNTEARREAVIAAATEVRDAVDVQMGAGRIAAVELDSSEAFCDCPVASVRGTAEGAAVEVSAAARDAAREAGFEHFEPLAVPDGLDPASTHGFTASMQGLDLSFRADEGDGLLESEVVLTVRDTDDDAD